MLDFLAALGIWALVVLCIIAFVALALAAWGFGVAIPLFVVYVAFRVLAAVFGVPLPC